ncbi:hypothetical protein, partial [Candidatus Sordicultor fermentans]|uniref:hypothetical protein n=1 Tax=Candidatus Sordicultor fermentans TaxID=1953203 RepID=UPI0039089FF5
GVTKKAIEPFRNNGQGDDRSIQGQAKNGSEVAGVTKKAIEPFRGDEQGAFPPCYFLSFSFVFLYFRFSGGL